MRSLDLFSGIGGFALGFLWAGIETVQFVEVDPYCRQVLAKNFPGVPCHDDIHAFNARPLRGKVDIVCGGFPCQPYSVAGQRRGAADDRALWPEMLRIIKECQPAWIVAENVAGFIGMGLDSVFSDLETAGYEATAFVIPACAAGAPHRRDRVWIVGHANRHRQSTGTINDEMAVVRDVADAAGGRCGGTAGREIQQPGRAEIVGTGEAVAHTNGAGRQEQYPAAQPAIAGHGPWRFTAAGYDWPAEPEVGRVAYGVPRRVDRIKALGNAVVPQITAMIGAAILAAERGADAPLLEVA